MKFKASIEDSHEGFCLKLTELDDNNMFVESKDVYTSMSRCLVESKLNQLRDRIENKFFRLIEARDSKTTTYVEYEPRFEITDKFTFV